jgi:putative protease
MNHELLLPVGTVEMALAAIHNGADAIYVGFPGYNARGRATDFEVGQLREIIETCHLHGVKTNLALNILIFQDELEKLVPLLEQVLPLKPDAFIVQDLGLARLLRKMAPDQVIHASTQMTVTNPDAIALLDDLGIKRFVLGRENSIKEIELIKEKTHKDLEVFVHGALCVSYSGQCFTSESIGGRSANRGQCAQSCRFSYELYVDGEKRALVEKDYLVSPRDLCGIAEIPKLMDLGVHSFKIEGRLKSPEYVASAAREYRLAMDRHAEGRDLDSGELEAGKARMATTYSRGFFTGWMHGVDHQQLVDGASRSHRGVCIGKVSDVLGSSLLVELEPGVELSPGDGLLWASWIPSASPAGWSETGAQLYEVARAGGNLFELRFGNDVILKAEAKGARLFLTHDASQKKDLRRSFQDRSELKKIAVDVTLDVAIGKPLLARMTDGRFTVEAAGASPVQEARTRAVSDEFLRDELGALGGTAFSLRELAVRREDARGIFTAQQELKELRRRLSAELARLRAESRITAGETRILPGREALDWLAAERRPRAADKTRLNVLLREKAQVLDLIGSGLAVDCVILDYEFGMDYEASVLALRNAGIRCGIATTRILKPKEYTHFTRIERLAPDVVLVRNLGALRYFTEVKPIRSELRGDFSLNVTNHLTADYLLSKGLASVTASYDLNSGQVSDLLAAADASRIEITAHQYMPSFHMEHCVFAAFLSKGSSFRDCGKPCEKHRVELKDQFGNRHQLKADAECRNTMYNSVPQSAARFLEGWSKQGLGFARYEALYERGAELIDKIAGYRDLISGARGADQVIADLSLLERYGLGEGAIAKTREYQSRKKGDSPSPRSG